MGEALEPAPAPDMVTMTRDQLNALLVGAKEEGKASVPLHDTSSAPPVITGGVNGGDDEKLTVTRKDLRDMLRGILAEARVGGVAAANGVPRSFTYDHAQHEAVQLPNAALFGHVVVETDVPGEYVHTMNGELYGPDGQRLGKAIVVHHAEAAA